MKRSFDNLFPLLVVLAVLFLLGYPFAFLMGYPLAKTNLEDHNRWSQQTIKAFEPVNVSDLSNLKFTDSISAETGLLVFEGTPVRSAYTVDGQLLTLESDSLQPVQLTPLSGQIDGQNQVFRTERPTTDHPLYLNDRLLEPGYEKPPEKPDGVRLTFTFTDTQGVFALHGQLLVPGKDYTLDGTTLTLSQPAPLWLSLRTEPDWARPIRVTGDYAWADDATLVLKQAPPAGSTLQLASAVVRWAQRLDGVVDGQNRTFHLRHKNLVSNDAQRQIYVDDHLLRTQGRRPQQRADGQTTTFTFPEPGGIITLNGNALTAGQDYEQNGQTVTFKQPPPRLGQLLQFDYVIADAEQSQLVLALPPASGSVVWANTYTVYDKPRCGTNVFECFLSLPQHPVPLPHWLFTTAPTFFAKHPWESDTDVVREVLYTARGTLVALLAGGFVGLLLAALFVIIRPLERALLPWVIASQTVPIIALVPMLVLILANFGITIQTSILPTAIIGGYLSFFPITVGATKGLRSVDPLALDLMRSYAASKWQVFFKVRLFAAVPFIFASFKVGAAASLVGTLISETETSNAKGLGFAILGQVQAGNVADLWLLFIISSLMGIVFVSAVGWVERLVAPWMRKV